MNFKLPFWVMLIACTHTWAQENQQNESEKSNPHKELPINLLADHGEYDAIKGVATYTGNVVITQGDMNLTGNKVVIHLQDGEVETIESWGDLATFRYIPEGEPPIDGKGEYMIYSISESTVDIDKQAYVKQEDNNTTGDHLTYYLKEDLVRGTRIHMTLQPKSS